MKFTHKLAKLFGWLLLVFSGGCALTVGIIGFLDDRMSFFSGAIPVILVTAGAGWLLLRWGRKKRGEYRI